MDLPVEGLLILRSLLIATIDSQNCIKLCGSFAVKYSDSLYFFFMKKNLYSKGQHQQLPIPNGCFIMRNNSSSAYVSP